MIAGSREREPRNWQRCVAFSCAMIVCFFSVNTHAMTRVGLWGAPAAVVQQLRATQSQIDWQPEPAGADTQLHIAWHADAYDRLLTAEKREPILLLTSSLTQHNLTRAHDSALIWGPPLLQQVRLARRVMPLAKRVGVIARRGLDRDAQLSQTRQIETLAAGMRSEGITLVPLFLSPPITARAIAEASEQVDIFVATNDETLFNRDTAKLILLTAYRHQKALIGPSPAFVSAGAVATMAVPKSALIAELIARVERWQKSGRLGESKTVEQFQPILNPQVARSLGLYLTPDLLREAQP